MSEKLNISHHSEQLQPNPAELQFTPETGAINFSGLAESVNGLRAALSQRRLQWAEDRLERMDHKDSLYTQTGVRYMSGSHNDESGDIPQRILNETSTSNPDVWGFPDGTSHPETAQAVAAKPQSFLERMKVQRMEAKRHKLMVAQAKRKYNERASHIYETQNPVFRDKERYGESDILEVIPSNPVDTMRRSARRANKARQAGVRLGYYTSDEFVTPEDRRRRLNLAKANVTPHESKGQAKYRKREERAVTRLLRAADQPILGTWRNWRRNEAIEDIKRHTKNANTHRQRQAAARTPAAAVRPRR